MEDFPEELCGLWIDEDGRGVYIKKIKPLEFETTVIFDISNQLKKQVIHIDKNMRNLITRWTIDEQRRVKRLQVEVGMTFIGPTYNLYLSKNNENLQNLVKESNDIRLYPEVQMGLYDDWEDDLGVPWAFPYKDYKKASRELETKIVSKLSCISE
ncbi:MAG: hypothetical protein ACFFDW_07840 [Candidatus Thorarchaeota archaeon]